MLTYHGKSMETVDNMKFERLYLISYTLLKYFIFNPVSEAESNSGTWKGNTKGTTKNESIKWWGCGM